MDELRAKASLNTVSVGCPVRLCLFTLYYPTRVGVIVFQHTMFHVILKSLTSVLLMLSGIKPDILPQFEVELPNFDQVLPFLKADELLSLNPFVQSPKTTPINTSTSKQVTALRRAIIGQESGGNFLAVNPDSGALGYGQLMEFNVAPWTQAALGRALTPEEFLYNPEAQIQTIDYKLNEYLQRELAFSGSKNLSDTSAQALRLSAEEIAVRRVASTWYSGNPNLWNNTRPQYYNGRPYPSIANYTASVWQRYQRERNAL